MVALTAAALLVISGGAMAVAADGGKTSEVVAATGGDGTPAAAVDTLVWVNGAPITTADLDRLLEETHHSMSQEGMRRFDPRKLLDKAINDELLVQQAEALGLEEEPGIRAELEKIEREKAASFWLRDHYRAPSEVGEARLKSSYRVNYERMQLRQMSLRTRDEAERAREAVLAGADMDSMARASSLDTKKLAGGLHHELPLLEIPSPLSTVARNLQPGEVSEIFPYRDAWSFVRMEKRSPAPDDGFERERGTVEKILLDHDRKRSWRAFMDSLKTVVPVREHEAVISAIRADSTQRLKAGFLKGTNDPAFSIASGPSISDYELRQEISHQTMNDGTASFSTVFERAVEATTEALVLDHLAQRDGYAQRPEVRRALENARRKKLIEAYLAEAIVPKIRFSHREFQQYYDQHKEEWRGPEQVLLDIVVISNEEQAEELAERLRAGSDFDRIKGEYTIVSETEANERSWASLDTFSDRIQKAVAGMKVGDVSGPDEISQGWLFFQLDGRRPGRIPSLEEVDATIRGVMFQKKFNELLDEHLRLLKSRSTIVRNESAIESYFSRGS